MQGFFYAASEQLLRNVKMFCQSHTFSNRSLSHTHETITNHVVVVFVH